MSSLAGSPSKKTLKLLPEDIEGAEISEERLESGKVTKKKLKRWLRCRKGASTTGTKSVLLKRRGTWEGTVLRFQAIFSTVFR
jgi:hypothetical protein